MELYNQVSYAISQQITVEYSTSFSSSARLFPGDMRPHIYAIYGLVRIADEIVDTYRGDDSQQLLRELELEVYAAIKRGYSVNPVVQSFALTAQQYDITSQLIEPFFASMLMDVNPVEYNESLYETYIYGSAEVVGLMCLKVFVGGDEAEYKKLEPGARALGAGYQKVNFLRDMKADYEELGRLYFPGVNFETFDEEAKGHIIEDIEADFGVAKQAVDLLPTSSRQAVGLSLTYYSALLSEIKKTPVQVMKARRIRVNNLKKSLLFVSYNLKRGLGRG